MPEFIPLQNDWHWWFYEEPLTSMEPFHCTEAQKLKKMCSFKIGSMKGYFWELKMTSLQKKSVGGK